MCLPYKWDENRPGTIRGYGMWIAQQAFLKHLGVILFWTKVSTLYNLIQE